MSPASARTTGDHGRTTGDHGLHDDSVPDASGQSVGQAVLHPRTVSIPPWRGGMALPPGMASKAAEALVGDCAHCQHCRTGVGSCLVVESREAVPVAGGGVHPARPLPSSMAS
jgi:hypothetical protein